MSTSKDFKNEVLELMTDYVYYRVSSTLPKHFPSNELKVSKQPPDHCKYLRYLGYLLTQEPGYLEVMGDTVQCYVSSYDDVRMVGDAMFGAEAPGDVGFGRIVAFAEFGAVQAIRSASNPIFGNHIEAMPKWLAKYIAKNARIEKYVRDQGGWDAMFKLVIARRGIRSFLRRWLNWL